MAARNFRDGIQTLHPEVKKIWVTGTGAGAANLTALVTAGGGVVSIAETATGKYTVTLSDKFNRLLQVTGTVIDPTAPDDWEVGVVSESVASAKTIAIAVWKGGAATDLTSDEKLMLEITVSNSDRLS